MQLFTHIYQLKLIPPTGNIDTILYRSTFEYHESSFEKLKEAVNNYRLKKVEPYNYDLTDENTILRSRIQQASAKLRNVFVKALLWC